MMNEILYTVAKDKDGSLVKANDALKTESYYCPVCNGELILKKSGKVGKGSKRPHFAHRTLTPNCTPETALHYSFKHLMTNELNQYLAANKPLAISWNCTSCHHQHSEDLIKDIHQVRVEYNMKVCQPDIALLDAKGMVRMVIEVVVTHKPEPNVIQHYKDNRITLVQYNIKSDSELEMVNERLLKPDVLDYCTNPRCETCGSFQQKRDMWIIDGHCWNCGELMKVAVIDNGLGEHFGPINFSMSEVKLAQSKGVMIEEHFSNLANTCPWCGFFTGEFYLYTEFFSPAAFGDYESEVHNIGYNCGSCSPDNDEFKV